MTFAEHMLRYPYLFMDIVTLFFPFILSFDKKVAFYKQWRRLALPLLISAVLYIVWDSVFVRLNVWHFNYNYLLGPSLLELPLEEWLFFMVVPYACVFIYACYTAYTKPKLTERTINIITIVLLAFLGMCLILFWGRLYTTVTFSLTILALIIHWRIYGTRLLENIYMGWLICLIPFFMVNGVLTALPVVIYNNAQNMGVRLYTIPFEDIFYGFLLYLLIISGMEFRTQKSVS